MGKAGDASAKWGGAITLPEQEWLNGRGPTVALNLSISLQLPRKGPPSQDPVGFYGYVRPAVRDAGFQYVGEILEELKRLALKGQESRRFVIESLSRLYDRIYDAGKQSRSSLLQIYHEPLNYVFSPIPCWNSDLYNRLA